MKLIPTENKDKKSLMPELNYTVNNLLCCIGRLLFSVGMFCLFTLKGSFCNTTQLGY